MELHIAYSSDDNFVRHMYVSIMSMFESQTSEHNVHVYVIDNNISKQNKQYLDEMASRYNNQIQYIPFAEMEEKLKGTIFWGGSLSSYGRLFLAEYVPADLILYLDGDSIVCGDLSELFLLDMKDYYFAAVQDTAGPRLREAIGVTGKERYINSGVTLINAAKWRADNMISKFMEFNDRFEGNVPCCDQGILNGVCKGRILYLHPKYNLMTPLLSFDVQEIKAFFEIPEYYEQQELEEARENPVFIHYVGGFYVRPWFAKSDHPKKDVYQSYMQRSPWKDQYLATENLGVRTKMMRFLHKYLPFALFIAMYRATRFLKNFLKKEQ